MGRFNMAASGNMGNKNVGKTASLFPAFSSSKVGTKIPDEKEPVKEEIRSDWLSFSSFKTEDALAIHEIQRAKANAETEEKLRDIGKASNPTIKIQEDISSEDSDSDSSDNERPERSKSKHKRDSKKKKKSK